MRQRIGVSISTRGFCRTLPVLVAGVLLFHMHCATRADKRITKLSADLEQGKWKNVIEQIHKQGPRLYGNLNRFLYWYDLGVLYHFSDNSDSSRVCLEQAALVSEELYARSLTGEALSLITSDNLRPYRPRRYEHILLHQLLALSYLSQANTDAALVEARRTQLVTQRYLDQKRPGFSTWSSDPFAHYLAALSYEQSGEIDNAAISMFHAVALYRQNSFPLPSQIEQSAVQLFWCSERLADLDSLGLPQPDSTLAAPSCNKQTEVILTGYAGRLPGLGETVFWGQYIAGATLTLHYRNPDGDTLLLVLPAPELPTEELEKAGGSDKVSTGKSFFVKFAIPSVVPRTDRTAGFRLSTPAGERPVTSEIIGDMAQRMQSEFEQERTGVIIRTAIRVVLRTLAAQKAKDELQSASAGLNFLVSMGSDIAQGQAEKADTRSCFVLPARICQARIALEPGTHHLVSEVLDRDGAVIGTREYDITLAPGERKYLFHTSLD